MDLELSDDQIALQEAVQDFLDSECPISLVRQVAEDAKASEELWKKMVELDWPAMAVDEADGGLGLGFVEVAVVSEQLGRALAPVPFMSTAVQFASALRLVGSEEQRRSFLTRVAGDGMVGTLAVAEASGSYEISDIETMATPHDEGWVLNGEKHFVLDGARADEIVVAARIARPGGGDSATSPNSVRLFVVPQESVSSNPLASLDPTRQYATVKLDGVFVGADRALGSSDDSSKELRLVLDEAATALSAEIVGACQSMFDIVRSYATEREQFGVKIGSFQAIKHKLADMYVALESARAVSYFAALCIAEGDDRATLAVPTAKSGAGDCQKLIGTQSIQSLGGIGYTWEHDIHLFVKRAKASAALFGTAAEHRERVARLIGLEASEMRGEGR